MIDVVQLLWSRVQKIPIFLDRGETVQTKLLARIAIQADADVSYFVGSLILMSFTFSVTRFENAGVLSSDGEFVRQPARPIRR